MKNIAEQMSNAFLWFFCRGNAMWTPEYDYRGYIIDLSLCWNLILFWRSSGFYRH